MRKQIVSLAVAALICAAPVAFAGPMSATPITIDLTTAPDVITLPDLSMTFGNDLKYQDGVTIFVDGADAVVSANPFDNSCDGYSGGAFGAVGSVASHPDSWQART